MLTIAGTAAMSAAGSMTRNIVSNGAHADADRRLDLADRHGGEAGAKDLGEIGRRVKAEAEDAGGGRAEPEPDRRAAGVEQEELHQKRRAAEDLDERPDEPVQRRDLQPTEKRDREPEGEAERAAGAPAEDGDAEAAEKRGRIMPESVQAHRGACPRQASFRHGAEAGQAKVDREIEQAAADIGFERPIGLGRDVHADARQFGDADHRNERRGFDQEDELVDERRDRNSQRLRQKNAPPDVEAGEAERGRRLRPARAARR